jgi:hypothetical protein
MLSGGKLRRDGGATKVVARLGLPMTAEVARGDEKLFGFFTIFHKSL